MWVGSFKLGRRGQGTVENLMLTAIIAGVLMPIVYKTVISPMLKTFQGERGRLVKFISQEPKKPVPNAWFKSERLAQLKDPKNIQEPKEINSNDLPEPGTLPPGQDLNDPKDLKGGEMKQPKELKEPRKLNEPKAIQSGNIGTGKGGSNNGSSVGAQDPDFFGGGDKKDKSGDSGGAITPGDGSVGKGSVSGGGRDEYAPKKTNIENQKAGEAGRVGGDKKDEAGPDKKSKQNLVVNEVRQEERERSSGFDWWLLVKVLIIGLIIFLSILIGLSNMKKR